MINTLYKRGKKLVVAWVTERIDRDELLKRQGDPLVALFAAGIRIHSWAEVKVGDVHFRDVLAVMAGPLECQISAPPLPLRLSNNPAVEAPPGDFFKQCHILADPECDAASKPFIRSGLWFSGWAENGTVVGYMGNLYFIPAKRRDKFVADIRSKGPDAFNYYDSFPDPTASVTGPQGVIAEPDPYSGSATANGDPMATVSESQLVISELDPYSGSVTAKRGGCLGVFALLSLGLLSTIAVLSHLARQ
ncbi:MAG: hypothetical protein KJZ78_14515 [Bryobacteraceae bacterium]|nr:hypothetical protein [Bryobacteraceae bacterium]